MKYIVRVITDFRSSKKKFDDEEKARLYFNRMKEDCIQMIVEDNGLSEEEEIEYREELKIFSEENYVCDPDGNWEIEFIES